MAPGAITLGQSPAAQATTQTSRKPLMSRRFAMGFTLSLSAALLAPLQCLVGFFAPWAKAAAQPAGASVATRPLSTGPLASQAARPNVAAERAAAPVRVLRVRERGTSQPARVVISGRMADVCAELERLAAIEAAASCH